MALSMIGGVKLDVVTKLSTNQNGNITTHSVESGSDISDYAKQESEEVDISAILIGDDAEIRLARLIDHQRRGRLVGVIGRTRHSDMYLTNISPDYDYKISNGIAVGISLKKVKIAVAKKVLLNAVNPNTKKADAKTNTKVKATTNGGTKQASKSGLGGTTGLSNVAVAKEVVRGKWGNGRTRVELLTKAGYNPKLVQAEVNRLLR